MILSEKSTHQGYALPAFPQVCKMPAPVGSATIAIPYPITAGQGAQQKGGPGGTKPGRTAKPAEFKSSAGDEAGARKGLVKEQQLKQRLGVLHQKLMTLNSANPTVWHAALDEYVIATAEHFQVKNGSSVG